MEYLIAGLILSAIVYIFFEYKQYKKHINKGKLWSFEDFLDKFSNINIDDVYGIKLSRDERLQIANGVEFYYDNEKMFFHFIDFMLVRLYLLFKKNRNILGYVERHDRKLIIMRALPGAGKSTKAKELVGNGEIHSTDDIMTRLGNGDYKKAFSMEINGKPALSVAHRRNFFNVIGAMETGVSPVIVDNTNIKRKDVKKYAKEALMLGYKDHNIEIIDLGLNGFTLEELVERNTHGVDLQMMTKFYEDYNNNNPVNLKYMFKDGK